MPSAVSTPDPVRVARSRLANAIRRGDDPADARRVLTTAKLRRAVDEALADEHAPSDEDLREIAEILIGGAR